MPKKISLFPIVSLVLFLLVLLAGYLLKNSFGKTEQLGQSSTSFQSAPSIAAATNPTPLSSEQAFPPTATLSINPYPAPIDTIEPSKQITPTTESITFLPPLTPYPAPGPYKNMRLIYTRADKPGYWINSIDGNEERELTGWWRLPENSRKYDKLTFKPSPSGEYLLFSASDNTNINEPESNSFWVNKLDGSQPIVKITANEIWFPENPIWSPDGKQIAYRKTYINKSESGDLITGKGFEIWTMNIDGSSDKKLYSDPNLWVTSMGGELPLFTWLYNGYIYFAVNDPSGPVYAVNPTDGMSYQLLDNIPSLQWRLSLSPDGKHVGQSTDVTADEIKKAGLIPVDVPLNNEQPKWSAEGTKLLYREKDKNDKDKVRVILYDLSNGNKKEVLKLNEKDKLFSLSPGNQFIAYRDETEALYVFDLTTNISKLIAQGQGQSQQNIGNTHFVDWVAVP